MIVRIGSPRTSSVSVTRARQRSFANACPRVLPGDLGEILASELVEEETGFRVPVRRMRYKDGREVAMRGDDFIGVGFDLEDKLWQLKDESKSHARAEQDHDHAGTLSA
jgi:hypothetical protein